VTLDGEIFCASITLNVEIREGPITVKIAMHFSFVDLLNVVMSRQYYE
jgi:hypothetical protein